MAYRKRSKAFHTRYNRNIRKRNLAQSIAYYKRKLARLQALKDKKRVKKGKLVASRSRYY